jgi:hypothetical protein
MAIVYKEFRCPDETQFYPFDDENERFFRKVVSGFVPPGPKGGAIVVCGQEWVLRPPSPIFWIAEAQEQTTDNLIRRALDMKSKFKIEEFVGFLDDHFSRYLSFRNASACDQKKPLFHISPALNTDTPKISFHVTLIRDLLNPTKKLLHLGQSKSLRAALQDLSKSEIDTATARDHPLLAALCYAVSNLEVYQPAYGVKRLSTAKMDYDVLNYNN